MLLLGNRNNLKSLSKEIIDNGYLIMEEIEEMENTPVNSRKAVSYPSASAETPDVFSTHQPSTSHQRSRPQLSSLDSLLDDSTEATQSHSGKFTYFQLSLDI